MSLTPFLAPGANDADYPAEGESRRSNVRRNMFVVAALTSSERSGPVRIRNMSHAGALVEGAVIPPEGSRLRLIRGSLSVAGEVVWRRNDRAGLRFDAPVTVAEWMPQGNRGDRQQRIDEIVHIYKSGDGGLRVGGRGDEPSPTSPTIADELLDLGHMLRSATEGLVNDEAAAARHHAALQAIDVAAQKLEMIARRLV